MIDRIGRVTGFAWFTLTARWPAWAQAAIKPIDVVLELLPGYNQGVIKAYIRKCSKIPRRNVPRNGADVTFAVAALLFLAWVYDACRPLIKN